MIKEQKKTLEHKVNPNLRYDGGSAGIEDPDIVIDDVERPRYFTSETRYGPRQKIQQMKEEYQLDQYKD